jgi:hypothetical protein
LSNRPLNCFLAFSSASCKHFKYSVRDLRTK